LTWGEFFYSFDPSVLVEMDSYYKANSVTDAHDVLRKNTDASLIAGGQELMLDMRHGETEPDLLIDISEIDELTTITETADAIHIGACVTYSELETSTLVSSELPYFVDAVEDIAGPQVRNNGTIGGALCDADPVFDMPTVLLTLDTSLTADAGGESRTVPVSDFFTGYCQTSLDSDEVLTKISVPKIGDQTAGTYRSMTPREGDSTVVGVGVRLTVDGDGICSDARIALTNADVVPKRAISAESVLEGTVVTAADTDRAVEELETALNLDENHQTSRSYRKNVLKRLTGKAIEETRRKVMEENK